MNRHVKRKHNLFIIKNNHMKIIFTLLLFAGMISCINKSTGKSENKTDNKVQEIHQQSGIEFKIVPESYENIPGNLNLIITNHTKETAEFGTDYTIERLDAGTQQWEEFGPPEGTAFISIMYILTPGMSENYTISLYPGQLTYTAGTYRIIKNVFIGDSSEKYFAEFTIK